MAGGGKNPSYVEFMQGRLMKAESGQVEYNVAPSTFDGQGSILS